MSLIKPFRRLFLSIILQTKAEIKREKRNLFDGSIIFSELTPEEVNQIVKEDIDINQRDRMQRTLLMYLSSYNEKPLVIRALIEAGAEVNAVDYDGTNALMMAVINNLNSQVAEELIRGGAALNACNIRKRTPLMYAAKYNPNPTVVKILLSYGADGTLRDCKRFTAFEHLKKGYNSRLRKTEAFKLLKEAAHNPAFSYPNTSEELVTE
jgi:hypothetical protein